MVFRSDSEVALNDVIVADLEAADVHERAAGLIGEPELAAWLHDLARARRGSAQELGEEVRRHDDLPSTPDPERETLRDAVADVREALSADERAALLEESAEAEAKLVACAREALETGLSEAAGALVRRLLEEASAARARLDRLSGVHGEAGPSA